MTDLAEFQIQNFFRGRNALIFDGKMQKRSKKEMKRWEKMRGTIAIDQPSPSSPPPSSTFSQFIATFSLSSSKISKNQIFSILFFFPFSVFFDCSSHKNKEDSKRKEENFHRRSKKKFEIFFFFSCLNQKKTNGAQQQEESCLDQHGLG